MVGGSLGDPLRALLAMPHYLRYGSDLS
jgi:hypothetical protein